MSTPINAAPTVGTCPACGTKLRFAQAPRLGEFIVCEECGTELEVTQLTPVKLDWAFEEPFDDSDFDDDDWEYEEDDEDFEDEDYDDDGDEDDDW